MSASIAGVFINLTPIFGVSGAYLFLDERLLPGQWLGALLILLSVLMILRGQGLAQNSQSPSIRP